MQPFNMTTFTTAISRGLSPLSVGGGNQSIQTEDRNERWLNFTHTNIHTHTMYRNTQEDVKENMNILVGLEKQIGNYRRKFRRIRKYNIKLQTEAQRV